MAKLTFQAGTTSKTLNLFIQDSTSTTGVGKTGLAYNTASLTAYYVRPRAAAASITLATQTVTGAWSSGGFVEIDATNMPGWYRLDIPNAVLAAGVDSVGVLLKGATGMVPLPLEIDLGSIDVTVDAVWDEELTGATHNVPTSAGRRLRQIAGQVVYEGTAQGSGVGPNQIQLDVGASSTNGAYDPAVIAIISGAGAGQCRLIYEYTGATRMATVDRDWKVNPDNTSVFTIFADPGRESVNEGLMQSATSTTAVLNALASTSNDAYKGQTIFVRSGTGADQARVVIGYVGATKTATLDHAWDVIPDSTSAYATLPTSVAYIDSASIRAAIGLASANLDTQLDALDGVAPIKAKTDSLTFTVAGQLDANIQYVNDVQVQGNGQTGTEWGPV